MAADGLLVTAPGPANGGWADDGVRAHVAGSLRLGRPSSCQVYHAGPGPPHRVPSQAVSATGQAVQLYMACLLCITTCLHEPLSIDVYTGILREGLLLLMVMTATMSLRIAQLKP